AELHLTGDLDFGLRDVVQEVGKDRVVRGRGRQRRVVPTGILAGKGSTRSGAQHDLIAHVAELRRAAVRRGPAERGPEYEDVVAGRLRGLNQKIDAVAGR